MLAVGADGDRASARTTAPPPREATSRARAAEVERGRLRRGGAGEVEEPREDRLHPLARRHDPLDALALALRNPALQELGGPLHDGERVAEPVREAGPRPGDRREPLALGLGRLAPLPLRHPAGRDEGEADEGERRASPAREDEAGERRLVPDGRRRAQPQPDGRGSPASRASPAHEAPAPPRSGTRAGPGVRPGAERGRPPLAPERGRDLEGARRVGSCAREDARGADDRDALDGVGVLFEELAAGRPRPHPASFP